MAEGDNQGGGQQGQLTQQGGQQQGNMQQQNGAQQGQQQSQPAWHHGIDADLLGVANNKGWKIDDPKEAFSAAAKAYKEAQSKFGVPPEELLRMPKANAAPDDIKAFRQRLGVPKEAKEYDLAGLKFAGSDLEEGFANALRAGLYDAGVTKDSAQSVIKPVLKYLEDAEAEESATMTAKVAKETEELNRSWGANKDKNEFIAKSFLSKLAAASGVAPEDALAAWDALSKVGGLGAAAAMKMLLAGGIRTGEDRYVSGGAGEGNMPLSREGALQRMADLKKDKEWVARYTNGGVKETQEWHGLHIIAHGGQRAA